MTTDFKGVSTHFSFLPSASSVCLSSLRNGFFCLYGFGIPQKQKTSACSDFLPQTYKTINTTILSGQRSQNLWILPRGDSSARHCPKPEVALIYFSFVSDWYFCPPHSKVFSSTEILPTDVLHAMNRNADVTWLPSPLCPNVSPA